MILIENVETCGREMKCCLIKLFIFFFNKITKNILDKVSHEYYN